MHYTNWQLIQDVKEYVSPYKGKFIWGSLARIVSDLAWLLPPWIISEVITFASNYASGDSRTYLWQLCFLFFIAILLRFLVRIAKHKLYWIAEKISLDAQLASIRHMFRLDTTWHEKENSGNKMKKITRAGQSLNKLVRLYVDLFIEPTINLVAALIIFYTLSWKLNLLLVLFFVTYYVLSLYLTRRAVQQVHVVNIEEEEFEGILFETINNVATIKSLGIIKNILPFLVTISKRLFKEIRIRISYFQTRSMVLVGYREFFRLGILAFTAWQVLEGQFEVGIIAFVLFHFQRINHSAEEFSRVYNDFAIAKVAVMRMKEIMNTNAVVEDSGHKKFKRNWKHLKLQHVTFSYKGRNVLKDLNLTIRRGEKVGIVGISGTGKTTLFKLLLKLYNDYEGDISFDTHTLRDIKRESYIEHVAVVPQDTELFHFSLKDNVTLTKDIEETKQKVLLDKAIQISHVHDFLHKLPQGMETFIGEKGIKLSGGEKQRVGIARAVFKQPDILLLDEATSHLDVESEKKIQDALHHFFKDITAIVIAHRLSTLKEMDRIIVIEQGYVVEEGTFGELIEKEGKFWQLWKKQKF